MLDVVICCLLKYLGRSDLWEMSARKAFLNDSASQAFDEYYFIQT